MLRVCFGFWVVFGFPRGCGWFAFLLRVGLSVVVSACRCEGQSELGGLAFVCRFQIGFAFQGLQLAMFVCDVWFSLLRVLGFVFRVPVFLAVVVRFVARVFHGDAGGLGTRMQREQNLGRTRALRVLRAETRLTVYRAQ